MRVAQISELLGELYEADGCLEFDEDAEDYDRNREEFADLLNDLVQQAGHDWDAVIEFLPFCVDETNEDFDWDTKGLRDKFQQSYRGGGTNAKAVIRDYFSDFEHAELPPIANDRTMADYFDWIGYIKDQRPDLSIRERGGYSYLFEGE